MKRGTRQEGSAISYASTWRRVRFGALCAAFACFVLPSIGAHAQDVDLPKPVEPGVIEKGFEKPELPRATFERLLEESSDDIPPNEAREISLHLTSVIVEGATVYSDADFAPIYGDLMGQDVTLFDIFLVADAITTMYRNDGYILSRALVPAQRISNGSVVIQVLEGFVSNFSIEVQQPGAEEQDENPADLEPSAGEDEEGAVQIQGPQLGPHERALLESYGRKIMRARPLSADTLERYILLADDLPGLTVSSLLTPGDQQGASDLILLVEQDKHDGFLTVDNRGTRFIGPIQYQSGNILNSVGGFFEETTIRAILAHPAKELKFVEVTEVVPLGSEGTTIELQVQGSNSRPDFFNDQALRDLTIESRNKFASATLEHPIIRSRRQNLSVSFGVDFRDTKVDLRALDTRFSEDRIRVASLGATYDFVDTFDGVNLIGLEVRRGFNVLGASSEGQSDARSRGDGHARFTTVNANLFRLQRIIPGITVLGAVSAQWSADQLLAAEEFGFGGPDFGRAYDPSEFLGDHGVALKIEPQWGETIGWPGFHDYQVYGFYDFGAVWNINAGVARSRETAASAGFGIRLNFTEWFTANGEFAMPLTRDVDARGADGDGRRFFFSVIVRY